jgi:hypothetical protein
MWSSEKILILKWLNFFSLCKLYFNVAQVSDKGRINNLLDKNQVVIVINDNFNVERMRKMSFKLSGNNRIIKLLDAE